VLGFDDSSFSRGIEKGQCDDFGGNSAANRFDRHFDVERGAEGRLVSVDASERDHLF